MTASEIRTRCSGVHSRPFKINHAFCVWFIYRNHTFKNFSVVSFMHEPLVLFLQLPSADFQMPRLKLVCPSWGKFQCISRNRRSVSNCTDSILNGNEDWCNYKWGESYRKQKREIGVQKPEHCRCWTGCGPTAQVPPYTEGCAVRVITSATFNQVIHNSVLTQVLYIALLWTVCDHFLISDLYFNIYTILKLFIFHGTAAIRGPCRPFI